MPVADIRAKKRALIIDAVAEFVTKDMARKSIDLEMGKPYAREWAKVHQAVGTFGWATKEEVIATLENIL